MNHNQRTPLARKIHVQLIDDLSGENAEETVRFSVDRADYEIDLTADNAAELRAALAKYIASGRRLRGPSASRVGTTAPMSREEARRIRDWATSNGYTPSTRGRISQDIQQAYAAAHA